MVVFTVVFTVFAIHTVDTCCCGLEWLTALVFLLLPPTGRPSIVTPLNCEGFNLVRLLDL